MTRPISEHRDKTAEAHYAVRQLQRRPAPEAVAGAIQFFHADADNNLGAGYTDLDWVDSGLSTNDGTTITVNGSANIAIASQGVYLWHLFSQAWGTPAVAGNPSSADYDLRVISGSDGNWSNVAGDPQVGTTIPLYQKDTGGAVIPVLSGEPDIAVVSVWQSTATFPAEIRIQAQYVDNNTPTANTTVIFRLGITRLGDAFE